MTLILEGPLNVVAHLVGRGVDERREVLAQCHECSKVFFLLPEGQFVHSHLETKKPLQKQEVYDE